MWVLVEVASAAVTVFERLLVASNTRWYRISWQIARSIANDRGQIEE
jgi:hypothetical protein